MAEDKHAREAIESGRGHRSTNRPSSGEAQADRHPAAGPHAKDELTDYDKTPGTGSLPSKGDREADVGPD